MNRDLDGVVESNQQRRQPRITDVQVIDQTHSAVALINDVDVVAVAAQHHRNRILHLRPVHTAVVATTSVSAVPNQPGDGELQLETVRRTVAARDHRLPNTVVQRIRNVHQRQATDVCGVHTEGEGAWPIQLRRRVRAVRESRTATTASREDLLLIQVQPPDAMIAVVGNEKTLVAVLVRVAIAIEKHNTAHSVEARRGAVLPRVAREKRHR